MAANNLALARQAEMYRVESLDTTNHGLTIVRAAGCRLTRFRSRA